MLPALFARQRGHNAIEARRALKAKVSQTPVDDVLRDIYKTTTDEKDGEMAKGWAPGPFSEELMSKRLGT